MSNLSFRDLFDKFPSSECDTNVATASPGGRFYNRDDMYSDSLSVDSVNQDGADDAADLGSNYMYGDDEEEEQGRDEDDEDDDMRLDEGFSDGDGNDDNMNSIDENRQDKVITPLGDLILVVGGNEVRVRVHSAVIRDAAPTMLNGIQASERKPAELRLPDEEPEAIELLCKIWHCTTGLASTPTPRVMFLMAQSASKFSAISRASLMARIWIKDLSASEKTQDLWYLLVTASLMRMGDYFATISRHLVMNHSGSFRNLIGHGEMDSVALQLTLALEEVRSKVRTRITDLTHSPRRETSRIAASSLCSCDPEGRQLQSWIWTAGDKFSPLDISTSTLYSIVHRVRNAAASRDWANWPCLRNRNHTHEVSGIPASINTEMTRITEATLGLCLMCFEDGDVEFGTCCHRGPDDSKMILEDLQGRQLGGRREKTW